MQSNEKSAEAPARRPLSRRVFGAGVFAALAAAYGTLGAFMARFLYPARPADRAWMYVTAADSVGQGAAVVFHTPGGAQVNIARQGSSDDTLVALSSVCPHLGCKVHWEPQNDRFFCPCHNGVFDPAGKAISGPPADANQSLLQYPLIVDRGMVFIELSAEEVALGTGRLEQPEVLIAQHR